MIYDVVFWYTGLIGWAVLALVFAVVAVLAIGGAFREVKNAAGLWWFLVIVGKEVNREKVNRAIRAAGLPSGVPYKVMEEWAKEFHRCWNYKLPSERSATTPSCPAPTTDNDKDATI